MKITFFIPDLRVGGAEKVLRYMINILIDKHPKFKVDLCLSNARGGIINEIDQRINIINWIHWLQICLQIKFIVDRHWIITCIATHFLW